MRAGQGVSGRGWVRRVIGSLGALAIVASGTIAVPAVAHALTVCTNCQVVANEDNYTIPYSTSGASLKRTAVNGVLANDEGPSTTIVDLQDTPDMPGGHTVTTLYGYTVTINNDGSFMYKADGDFSGIDSFDYYIWDSKDHDNFDFGSVYITIEPKITDDTYVTSVGNPRTVAAPGVLANDLGVDPDSLAFDDTSAHGGHIDDNLDGGFTYTPPPFFAGVDTFTYEVWDLNFDIVYVGVVTINVTGVGMTVPGPPTGVGATGDNASATVTFTPPANNGGATISGYQTTCTSSNGGATGTASAPSSPITVTGLTNGKTYTCTVRASNIVGAGNPSVASNAFVPATVPGAPTGVNATPLNGSASVAFSAPADDGGAEISGYSAACTSSDGGAAGSASGTASPITVTGLTNGKTYTCTVRAANVKGQGAPSSASNSFVPVRVPDAPTNVTATADTGSATVAFTPGSDGGSPVTHFDVTCDSSDGGAPGTASGASSPITVSGLTNGKSYSCRVTATSARGTSEPSAPSNSFVPSGCSGACVSIGDEALVEGDAGNYKLTFPVTLSNPAATNVTVKYAIVAGSATIGTKAAAGVDVKAKSGTLTFKVKANGFTTTKIDVGVTAFGDTLPEGDETFTVVLSDPTGGYQIGRGVGTGTLLDNDTNGGGLTVGIGDSSVVNAQSGKQNVTVPVVLSGPAPGPLTVSYTVTPQSAEYSAKVTGGGNFGGKLAGTIKFAAGARFKNVNIPIWARPNLGTDKTFTITLTGVTGGDVAITRATGSQTIVGGF